MNRIVQISLLFLILTLPAPGQEPAVAGQAPADSGQAPPDSGQEPAVAGQEPADSGQAPADSGQAPAVTGQKPDTLGLKTLQDTVDHTGTAENFIPPWEGDTVQSVGNGDTVTVFQPPAMVQADSLKVAEPDFSHSPSKATMFSLAVPGLGQVYNRKYWKVPIVWAAFGAAGYAISFNSRYYGEASNEYALLQDDTNERILQYWRRNLEISYIALIAVYALQVLDAYVDAQLYSWDVNEDLSIRVAPSMQPLLVPFGGTGHAYGLGCTFDLRRR